MQYNKKVEEHFLSPKNLGKLEQYTYTAEAANPTCGDAVKFYFDTDEDNKISKVGIEVLGCGAAIAASSMASEMIIGKKISELKSVTNDKVVSELGGLPDDKINCSVLVNQAFSNIKEK
jgi:nitrogen fixation protein NifU and related proteins